MFHINCYRLISRFLASAGTLLLVAGLATALASGQEGPNAAPSNPSSVPSSAELTKEVRALADTVRDLKAQMQTLNSQLSELLAKEQGGKTETRALFSTPAAPAQTPVSVGGANDPYAVSPAVEQNASGSPDLAAGVAAVPQNQTLAASVSKLEDDQQLLYAKLDDLYQTKVESESKYRLRLSGMVLMNLFDNQGSVDNADFPAIVNAPNPFDSGRSFGGTIRQSEIRIQAFGPQLAGARTAADVTFDFAGGSPTAPNGSVLSLPRFRTGTIRLDWKNTSIVAGQDFLFFAPLQPTFLATVAIPPLSYSGNLWGWTPQVRLEHHVNFSETSNLLFEGGILDSLTGDLPFSQYDRYPSWGEQSGQPGYAGRIAWSRRAFGQNLMIGQGGYYGRQYWGLGRDVNGWAVTTDLTLPLGPRFTVTGEFYRGSALGGWGGAIGQTVLLSGLFEDPTTVIRGLDSVGGWAQLKFKANAKFEINGAFGQDNPFAKELRMFSNTPPVYGSLLARNRSALANFIYHPKSDVLLSLEYRRIRSFALDDSNSANHINFSVGYLF